MKSLVIGPKDRNVQYGTAEIPYVQKMVRKQFHNSTLYIRRVSQHFASVFRECYAAVEHGPCVFLHFSQLI